MSLWMLCYELTLKRFPRSRGDEPEEYTAGLPKEQFSPLTRG